MPPPSPVALDEAADALQGAEGGVGTGERLRILTAPCPARYRARRGTAAGRVAPSAP